MPFRLKVWVPLGIVMIALTMALFATPVVASTVPTRTPKMCHICETAFPASTATPTGAVCEEICTEESQTTPVPNELDPGNQFAFESGVVKAVLFWMEDCPSCDSIKSETIPKLEAQYGTRLQILPVELRTIDEVDLLYQLGAQKGLSKEEVGVPTLLIGEQVLLGSDQIDSQTTTWIEVYLQEGGVGFPDLPELVDFLPAAADAPLPASPSIESTPAAPVVTPTPKSTVAIYFFWGDGCPHCATAKPFLQALDQDSERITLRAFEVWHDTDNQDLFTRMASAHGFEPQYVPTIFIGDAYWVGYNDQIQAEIQAAVDRCLTSGCPDAGAGIVPDAPVATIATPIIPTPAQTETIQPAARQLTLPLIGAIDLSSQSLLISTLLIAFVDGFNPCSVWVLTMLLALTLHTGSRKKVLFIGLIFLTVTAAIYGLFIAGMFTMFTVVSFVGWIQVVVALVALVFALVNIKDYFWYKEGVSFTIADERKPGIFQRMRTLMDASQSWWGLAGGTVVLAAGVSLVEFSCTAGFPVLWTNLLVAQGVPVLTFVLLLGAYLLVYQLDELGIFLVAVYSMRASRMEEKHGRILKLIGGMLMLTLAGVMLIDPNVMNDLGSSLIVFGAAFGATLLVLLVHRSILPAMGVRIGTELQSKSKKKNRRLKKGSDHAV